MDVSLRSSSSGAGIGRHNTVPSRIIIYVKKFDKNTPRRHRQKKGIPLHGGGDMKLALPTVRKSPSEADRCKEEQNKLVQGTYDQLKQTSSTVQADLKNLKEECSRVAKLEIDLDVKLFSKNIFRKIP